MPSWEILPGTIWRPCWVCRMVTRHDADVCMYDPASPIARLVRRDLPPAALEGNPHEPACLFDLPPVPPHGG